MTIAKDVLKLLDSKKIIPRFLGYFSVGEDNRNIPTGELCDTIEFQNEPCNVCALGGMLAAHVMKTDNFSFVEAFNESYKVKKKLSEVFSIEQLGMIETAYEKNDNFHRATCYSFSIPFDELANQKAYEFCLQCYNKEERLRMIMKNIIENNGEFKP